MEFKRIDTNTAGAETLKNILGMVAEYIKTHSHTGAEANVDIKLLSQAIALGVISIHGAYFNDLLVGVQIIETTEWWGESGVKYNNIRIQTIRGSTVKDEVDFLVWGIVELKKTHPNAKLITIQSQQDTLYSLAPLCGFKPLFVGQIYG